MPIKEAAGVTYALLWKIFFKYVTPAASLIAVTYYWIGLMFSCKIYEM